MEFARHDRVVHIKSGRSYMVLAGPKDFVRIESTGQPGYLYQEFFTADGGCIWARSAAEMEDGRFALECKTSHGAEGRFPE